VKKISPIFPNSLTKKGYTAYASTEKNKKLINNYKNKELKKGKTPNMIPKKPTLRNCATTITLIKHSIAHFVESVQKDPKGRFIGISLQISKQEYLTMWNVYGPPDGEKSNSEFFHKLSKTILKNDNKMRASKKKITRIYLGGT